MSKAEKAIKRDSLAVEDKYIKFQPLNCLEFLYTPFQIVAVLKIRVENDSPQKSFIYKIKTTNKKDYKITQPEGNLFANETKQIYFYLNRSASINQNLKDKFRVQVRVEGESLVQPNIVKTYNIVIQSALQKNINVTPVNIPKTNASRLASSVYSQQSDDLKKVYQSSPKSILPNVSKLRTSNIQNKSFVSELNQQERLEDMIEAQAELKRQLNEKKRQIDQLKRKVKRIDNQNKAARARARFRIYLTLFFVICCFLFGVMIKRVDLFGKIEKGFEIFGEQVSNFNPSKILEKLQTVKNKVHIHQL